MCLVRAQPAKAGKSVSRIKRTIERWWWPDYAAERIPVEIAGPKLKELQAQKLAVQAELTDCPTEQRSVALHPTALRRYQEHVAHLHKIFAQGITPENQEAAAAIRDLVARVTVHPIAEGQPIEVQGRLSLLMNAPNLYPNMRIAASGDRW